ncbi:unnamed protein product [Arabis nemorensis]|uniref:Uncharacterized protein n=1 Tax=Arabis nemorensis TaxID=586526 RepID=A0A565C993_9BRAS|nr:unnamed protein product [Arabis nemorensis]
MDVSQSTKLNFLDHEWGIVDRDLGKRQQQKLLLLKNATEKKENCTLPAQALPCSGSKGLSQPGPG